MKKSKDGDCKVIKKRGGARAGAGRPKANTHDVYIRLTDEQHRKFKELGGSAWLQHVLQNILMEGAQVKKITAEPRLN